MVLLSFAFLTTFSLTAQTDWSISFKPMLEQQPLVLNQIYTIKSDTFRIETLRFYISNISFLEEGKTVFTETGSYHLIDAEDSVSYRIAFHSTKKLTYDEIQFNVGIDSTTNVAGVMGGDLDPTKGMYWSWQSGYINFKLEGWNPKSTARKHEFQYHLGGYMAPYSALGLVQIPFDKNQSDLEITVQLASFLEQLNIAELPAIMSPGERAVELSQVLPTIFSAK
ncbi:MAG: MbnP family protein [Bacteroidota bacterium]